MASTHLGRGERLRELAIRHAIWIASVVLAGPYLAVWALLRNRAWPTSSWAWRALLIADLVAAAAIWGCYVRWRRRQAPTAAGAGRRARFRPGTWPLVVTAITGAVVLVATAVVAVTYEQTDSCDTPVRGAALEVMVIWKGDELAAFCDVAELYGHVEVRSVDVRMADALEDAFADGDPPDVAIVPQPSLVKNYAGQGLLCPVDDDVNERVPEIWRHFTDENVGNSGAEAPYGIVVKGTLKSMFWYRPDAFGDEEPAEWTLEQMKSVTSDWASPETDDGSTPGAALRIPIGDRWPLTDLFELLLASGDRRPVYVDMLQGDADWTDDEVIEAVDGALSDIAELLAVPGVVDDTGEMADLGWERSVETIDQDKPVLVFGPSFLAGPVQRLYGSHVLWPAGFPAPAGETRPFVVGADFAVLPRPTNDCGSGPGEQFVDFLAGERAIQLWGDRDPGFLTPNDASPFVLGEADPPADESEQASQQVSAAATTVPEARPSLDDARIYMTSLLREPPLPPEDAGDEANADEEALVFDLSDDQLARPDPAVTWQIMRDFYDEVAGTGKTRDQWSCSVQRARQRLAAEYENTAPPTFVC